MKQLFTLFLLLLPASMNLSAQEYYDLTDIYLKNARFDASIDFTVSDEGNLASGVKNIDHWPAYNSQPGKAAAVYQYGTAATFDGLSIPAVGPDGLQGSGLAMLADYAESSTQPTTVKYGQALKLAAGKYKFVAYWYNLSTQETVTSELSWVAATTKYSSRKTFAAGEWVKDSVLATVTVQKNKTGREGTLIVGFTNRQIKGAELPRLLLDRVVILRETPVGEGDIVIKKEELAAAIEQANAFYVEYGVQAIKTLSDQAQAVYDKADATMEEVLAVLYPLQNAIENAEWNYTKVVKMSFVRGATKCLVRLSPVGFENDGTLKYNVYLSNSPDDSVEGFRYDRTISSNGVIYVFDNINPCTLYYLHGSVTLSDGRVKYAEPVKFYTIPKGQVTCSYNNGGSAEENNRINNAINSALDYFNSMTSAIRNFNMGYSAGTPTADCNYTQTPWINMGANSSYQRTGTVMHEMQHGLGLIPYYTQWYNHVLREGVDGSGRGTGRWLGERAKEAVIFFSNDENDYLRGDFQHMWPYGINGASEDNGSEALYLANAAICQALGEDGLEHNIWVRHADPYYSFTQADTVKYYIKNESESRGFKTSFFKENAQGKVAWAEQTLAATLGDDHNAWYITFNPANQQYQFKNAATGKYLTLSGTTVSLSSTTTPGGNQNFHLMKGRVNAADDCDFRGYWLVRTSSWTPNCLNAGVNGAVGASALNLGDDAKTQRWVILTAEQLNYFDDGTLTAIDTLTPEVSQEAGERGVYDLQGRRLSAQPTKGRASLKSGVYIVNGKKVVVK